MMKKTHITDDELRKKAGVYPSSKVCSVSGDQPGTVRPRPVLSGEHGSRVGENANLVVNPDFALVRSDYRVRLAGETSPLHARAHNLVASMYGSRGLVATAPSRPGREAEQVTLAASAGHRVFGTLTLGMDSDTGLLADSLYRPEIDELRRRGRRLCEVTRLAFDPELSCQEVMATVFNVAFVLAREVHTRTDLLAEVHPRHAKFYRRTMGYRIAGPVRTCQRVRAPAVLLHLCLDFARSQIRQFGGTRIQGERSLYRLFLPAVEQEVLLKKLIVPDTAGA